MITYDKLQERLPRILDMIPYESEKFKQLNEQFVEKGVIDTIYIDEYLKTSARGTLLKVALDNRLYGAEFRIAHKESRVEIPNEIDTLQHHIIGVSTPAYYPLRTPINNFEQQSVNQVNGELGYFYDWMSYHSRFLEQRYMMVNHSTPRVLYHLVIKYPNIASLVMQSGFEANHFNEKVEEAILYIVENQRFKCSMLELMSGIYKARKEQA